MFSGRTHRVAARDVSAGDVLAVNGNRYTVTAADTGPSVPRMPGGIIAGLHTVIAVEGGAEFVMPAVEPVVVWRPDS